MQIELVKLDHQTEVLERVENIFHNVSFNEENEFFSNSNPLLDFSDTTIYKNIEKVVVDKNSLKKPEGNGPLVIDIKMETGTGKTCVYTELMYVLQEYGFNKFIIITPTTPIREGTRNFINSEYWKTYARKYYPNKSINLEVFETTKNSKKGRQDFPYPIRQFYDGKNSDKNKIYALLVGAGMLKTSNNIHKEYPDTLLDDKYSRPYEAISATRPIVILDEPHKFKTENKRYEYIEKYLNPQIIFRFGATFSDIKIGKTKIKDYKNLIYNLNSCKAFNDNLIKGVATEYLPNTDDVMVKILGTNKQAKTVKLQNTLTKKSEEIKIGNDLGDFIESLSGISVSEIDSDKVVLSNGQEVPKNFTFYPSTYGTTYQEDMIKLALDNHFETELNNVKRENKIKTLELFFIENRDYYRNSALEEKFDEILRCKLKEQIEIVKDDISLSEYKEFLEYSLNHIPDTRGGYFSKDNSTSDESIKQEVEDILRNKEKLLSFKDGNGNFNIRRFLFSQWTLKEGWDNPNVFTIAKLRSSGSEISKLQEVGRGLRLPVDEYGNRISNEEFKLNYIIDYSEKEFAEKLRNEVNGEVIENINIENIIKQYAEKHNEKWLKIALELQEKEFIDDNLMIINENKDKFFKEYSFLFDNKLGNDKIIDKNKKETSKVRVRKENFDKLKDLWKIINTKYYISFNKVDENIIIKKLVEILEENKNSISTITSVRKETTSDINGIEIIESKKTHSYKIDDKIPYNQFIKIISKNTNVPLVLLHKSIIEFSKNNKLDETFFTRTRLNLIVNKIKELKKNIFAHYEYKKLDIDKKETTLTDKNGILKEYVTKSDVGINMMYSDTAPQKFLYELPLYDSVLEKDNLRDSETIKNVIVYGKIPRRSVKIPMYWGGTYSPDFMYVIKNNDSLSSINCIIETKGVNENSDLRKIEDLEIKQAKKFYATLAKDFKNTNVNIKFEKQINTKKIASLIEELIL